ALLLLHVITRPDSTLPLASLAVAVSCTVCPVCRLADVGATVTVATGTFVTVMVAVPLFPSLVAVIVAEPLPAPVARPLPPTVTLQLTAMLAESPVLMNPTAVKSAVAFWRRVRILGETSRSAIVLPGSVARTGNSHATIAAVTSPARDARTTRSFSRARRDDSLCLNVMGLAPSWVCASRIEELAHVGRRGRSAGEDVHAEAFENEPQRARV